MNTTTIRSMTAHDRPAIQALFQEVFKQPMSDALWDWKYSNGRGVALIAFQNQHLVGHYGGVFRCVRYSGDQIQTLQCVDTMVSERARDSLARKGTYYNLAVRFLDQHIGFDRTVLIGYGFPHKRVLELGKILGVQSPVGKVLEPRWSALAKELKSNHLPEVGYGAQNTQHQALVDEFDRCMAGKLFDSIVGLRDANYVGHRYVNHPSFNYHCKLVFAHDHGRCLGLIVFRREENTLLLMDIIARLGDFAVLLNQTRRHAALLGLEHVSMWITDKHLSLLPLPSSVHDPQVEVPTSICTDGPSVAALSNKWFLTTGDTDFK